MNKSIVKLTEEQDQFYKLVRMRTCWAQPYIAHSILRLIPVNSPGLKTMGVDKYCRVYIDFEYFMAPERGVVFASQVLAHEPWHILRDHFTRAGEYSSRVDSYLWNIAQDAEINDDIEALIPDNSVFPRNLKLPDFETAEFYYANLIKKYPQQQPQQGSSGQPGDPSDGSSESGEGSGEGSDGSGQPGDAQGSGQPGDAQGSGQPGKGSSNGNQKGDKDGKGDKSGSNGKGSGEDLPQNEVCGNGTAELEDYLLPKGDADSVSQDEQDLLAQEAAQNIMQAAADGSLGKLAGKGAGNLQMWAEDKLKPTPTPWQKILRGAIKSALYWKKGQFDYNKKRPNRRQPIKGIQLPALQSPTPRILVGVDTSGSHVPMLPRVLEEVHTIMKSSGVRGEQLRVFSVDTVVKGKMVAVDDPRKLVLTGGGGTDMMPAFVASHDDRKNHDIFILMTDGEIPSWPSAQPAAGIRYVVCILSHENDTSADRAFTRAQSEIGSWAKLVRIIVPKEQN